MFAVKHFIQIIFLICIISLAEPKKEFPSIQDVVSFSDHTSPRYLPRVVKKIKSSIDVEALIDNVESLRKEIRGNLDDTMVIGPSRRKAVFEVYKEDYRDKEIAAGYQFRTKILDCMLQLIYMARHFLKAFERHEYLDVTSLSYRIGYICKHLRYLFHKSQRILEMLNIKQKLHQWRARGSAPTLTLHHKVAKMNVDFEYYYAVLKKLHALNRPYEPPELKQWQLQLYQLPTMWNTRRKFERLLHGL